MLPTVLFFVAWFGYAAFLTVCLNCLYGYPFPRKYLKFGRLIAFVLIVTGPIGVLRTHGFDLADTFTRPGFGYALLSSFVALCWAMAVVIWPAVTVWRWLTPLPSAVRSDSSVIVDIARQLGKPPAGQGRHRRTALLPGNQCFQVEFTTLELVLPNWPAAWDGVVLLHLSDLHLSGTPDRDFYVAVVERIMAEGTPDLLAVTGDIVDSDEHARWIVPVLGRLRWHAHAWAILGNHDTWHDPTRVRRRLRKIGLHTLGDRWQAVQLRGEPLIAIGHEGPWLGSDPDLSACPAGYRLLLSHTPDNLPWARRHGIGLMLSGHNHGGQIRVPPFGSIFVPSRFSRRYDMGTFASGPTLLHVNRGLAGREPLRYFCRPQVTRLILRSAEGVN